MYPNMALSPFAAAMSGGCWRCHQRSVYHKAVANALRNPTRGCIGMGCLVQGLGPVMAPLSYGCTGKSNAPAGKYSALCANAKAADQERRRRSRTLELNFVDSETGISQGTRGTPTLPRFHVIQDTYASRYRRTRSQRSRHHPELAAPPIATPKTALSALLDTAMHKNHILPSDFFITSNLYINNNLCKLFQLA